MISVRRVCQEVNLSKSTVHRAMRNVLGYKPYKMHLRQQLEDEDKDAHVVMAEILLPILDDENYDGLIFFSDEATFHVSDMVHKHNCRIWARDNPFATMEVAMNSPKVTLVFDYVKDKDVFEKFYHKMLFKRLLCEVRELKDYEELMILRLKNACGVAYISKLQKLYQDGNVSKTLSDQYRIYCEKKKINDIVDFNVLVRSSNSLSFSASSNFIIPIELKQTFDSFTKFYMEQYNPRKYQFIKWLFYFYFNKLSSWTVEQMQDETQIKIDLFLQVLYSLLKNKLITCSEINDNQLDEDFNESYIKMNYTIHINENFRRIIKKNILFLIRNRKQYSDFGNTIDYL
ncbi:unnamed protein product [Rotaria sp. Silwood1]|nr:unnamed protein product [Rotaria sp. Silwood1]